MTRGFKTAYGLGVVIAAGLAAVLVGALVLAAIGVDAGQTFLLILTEPLKDGFGLTEIGVRAVPLILVALGIAIAFRAGVFNIGAEGQIVVGVACAAATALALAGQPGFVILPLSLLAGMAGGAFWAGFAGWLKARLGVNEILSTVMLNYVAFQIYDFLLRGPMIDPNELTTGSGTPQSVRLAKEVWLDRLIPGFRLHDGIFIALALAVLVWLLLWRTTAGFRMRAAGAEPKAARYAGINVRRSLIAAMALSGALAGLAGAVEVVGVHHRAIQNISAGYGFSGIVVALFGMLHPAGIVPSALFFSLLIVGADMAQRTMGVPPNMVQVLEGAIILSIVAAQVFLADAYLRDRLYRRWQALRRRLPGAASPEAQ